MSFILLDNDSWLLGILLKAFNIKKVFFKDFFLTALSLSLSLSLSLFRNSNFYYRDCRVMEMN